MTAVIAIVRSQHSIAILIEQGNARVFVVTVIFPEHTIAVVIGRHVSGFGIAVIAVHRTQEPITVIVQIP